MNSAVHYTVSNEIQVSEPRKSYGIPGKENMLRRFRPHLRPGPITNPQDAVFPGTFPEEDDNVF